MTEESVRVRNAARREYWTAWFAAQTGAPRFTAQALWYNARGNPQTLREIVKLWEHRTIYDAVLEAAGYPRRHANSDGALDIVRRFP